MASSPLTNIVVRPVRSSQDHAAFARLIGEYVDWMRARYQDDDGFITEVLDQQSFSDELQNIPTIYGQPNGDALLAVAGPDICGCGAYRRLDATTCEMKRVFVSERFHGAGIGRRLCAALIDAARRDGYASMKLDSGRRQNEAANLYRSLGFVPCAPYHAYPAHIAGKLVFMERRLDD